jgi:K+/H+ antiporter YhaU regulatory subunit KhtT
MSLAMLRPAVSNFLNAVLYDRELQAEITESVIEKDSPFAGQTLAECGMAHGQDVLPLALLRQGKLMFSPLPDTVLEVGDALIIVTPIGNWRVSRT